MGDKKKLGAPAGNRNAAKEQRGLQLNYYLNGSDIELLDSILIDAGEEPSDEARRLAARELLRRAFADLARVRERDDTPIIY